MNYQILLLLISYPIYGLIIHNENYIFNNLFPIRARMELVYSNGYLDNYNNLMRVFQYKTYENNMHSFNNLINLCCFKEAISNFITITSKINKANNFFPEFIFIQELDVVLFKHSLSSIYLKRDLSKNSYQDCMLIYEGSKKEFLVSFRRLYFPNKFFICCFFLSNLKILDLEHHAFFLTINESIIDITYSPQLRVFVSISDAEIFVYKVDSSFLKNSNKNSPTYPTKHFYSFEDLNYNINAVNNQDNLFAIENSVVELVFNIPIKVANALNIEEINNDLGHIFAAYSSKSKNIIIFQNSNASSENGKLNKFQFSELIGHEGELVNVKKHQNYSVKNNILISLCIRQNFIVWNLENQQIIKKINLGFETQKLNFFIYELSVLRNDCIFLYTDEINKVKLLNFNSGKITDLIINSTCFRFMENSSSYNNSSENENSIDNNRRNNNKHKFLISHDKESFNCIEISPNNTFSVGKYIFKIKENFLC